MDWYAWLCRAGLHPDVAFEYALLFARNELGATDVRHLDHDFLLSMGVAVAKHRLEILKLARKQDAGASSSAASRLGRRATRCLSRCARRLAGGGAWRAASSSVTVVPRICGGEDAVRVGAVQRKGTGSGTTKKMVLMITDGGVAGGG